MRIAAFSDWRVQPFEPLISWLQSVKPDLILYAGDDTLRLGGFSHDMLDTIVRVSDNEEVIHNTSSSEEFVLRKDSTLKEFKKGLQERAKSSYRVRMSPSGEIIRESIYSLDGTWIGPPRRKRGTCLYYKWNGEDWFNKIAGLSTYGIGGVIGNDCEWVDRYRLSGANVYNLHREPIVIDNLAVLGLEGSPLDIGYILYEEDDARKHLEAQYEQTQDAKKHILVTHAPPKGVLDLSRRFDIHHIGSQAVREFIEERNIELVICGHSHINGGRYEKVGNCHVLNIASHDYSGAPGRVALIDLEETGNCQITTDVLYNWDTVLYKLHQLGEKRIERLASIGIDSLEKITEKNRKKMRSLQGISDALVVKWILEAKLLLEVRAVRIAHPLWKEIDLRKCLVYDIETDTLQSRVWSIGVYTSDDDTYTQFFEKDDEKKLLIDFFQFVETHDHLKPYTFSATDFDLRVIKTSARIHNLKLPAILTSGIDVGGLSVHRTLGTPKGGLKAIAPFFGYEWADKSMSGMQAGMLYSMYLRSGEEPDWDNLLQYNRDDVMATFWVLKKLLELEEMEMNE